MNKKIIAGLLLIICLGFLVTPRESMAAASTTKEKIVYLAEQLISMDNIIADQTSTLAKRLRLAITRVLRKLGIYRGANGLYSTSSLASLYGTTTTKTVATTTKDTDEENEDEDDSNENEDDTNANQATAYIDPAWFGSGDDSGTEEGPTPQLTYDQKTGSYRYDIGSEVEPVPGKSSINSQKIYEEARKAASGDNSLITSGVPGTNNGRKACAWAVATILERAGVGVGSPNDLKSTIDLNEALSKSDKYQLVGNSGKAFSGAVQGDVIVSPTTGSKTGHTGICMDQSCSDIASNSSDYGRFSFLKNRRGYTQLTWRSRFGEDVGRIIIYHAK